MVEVVGADPFVSGISATWSGRRWMRVLSHIYSSDRLRPRGPVERGDLGSQRS